MIPLGELRDDPIEHMHRDLLHDARRFHQADQLIGWHQATIGIMPTEQGLN